MPKITIDGKHYEVDGEQNLLGTCLSLGLNLPYFCWHPAMGSVGACRQCAIVEYKDADDDDDDGKLVMGCMTPVKDGGIYSIGAETAREFRGGIIEDLMTNHPHDCPVCEEGGECHLQDMTEMSGHTYRRFRGLKRTHRNQYLGPFINHEMNRCIACYRCVRFYRDYAGGDDLDALGRNNQVYFGRQCDGRLESGFSGNLVEVCPTGVFTDQTFSRHFVRKWDLQTAPSICEHCAVGCNTAPGARHDFSGHGENLRRVVNFYNRDINGYFICDRGRFGYEYANSDRRIKRVLVARREEIIGSTAGRGDRLHREVEPPAALELLAGSILEAHRGQRQLIGIGSPRTSLENNFALRQLVGASNFYSGLDARELGLLQRLDRIQRDPRIHSPTIPEIENADAVLVLDEDISRTAPRIALALRQAARNRQKAHAQSLKIPLWQDASVRQLRGEASPIFIVGSRASYFLGDIAQENCLATPADTALFADRVASLVAGRDAAEYPLPDELLQLSERVADTLKNATRPLVISGCGSLDQDILAAAGKVAACLGEATGTPCATYLACPEANSLGLAQLFPEEEGSLDHLLQYLAQRQPESPPVSLLLLENDLYRRMPAESVETLFDSAAELILLDTLFQPCSRRADLVFPAAATPESQGSFVNSAGAMQRYYAVYEGAGYIQESWRWLVDAVNAPACRELSNESPAAALREWEHSHDVTEAIARTVPGLTRLSEVGPGEDFRIEGMKVARQSHRASGRTANRADQRVAERPPHQDPDSPFTFTMEGIQYAGASPLQANIWSPGWNSNQAIHKFQQGIGGRREGGDGNLVMDRIAGEMPAWDAPATAASASPHQPGEFRLVPVYRLFGSGELSNYSPSIAELAGKPLIQVSQPDASAFNIESGAILHLQLESGELALEAAVSDEMAVGVLGIPRGLKDAPELNSLLPATASVSRVEQPAQEEEI
ncbi:NADH-quinone oxidoreductase subunit NuoG [Microbulbifer yueqingensis]|uniref:NADH-quinone oxidoreductase subunit G n=1 Tax=Microbulbifer yueqingensis TaxID=658219 RepID=A0A1G8WX66_9GAMM|nr:NADH-quinone oxidoreductase subunit NuoG [Microbulbifer yueqingensis]SDJ82793.1 NADH dehydrogenase subunit G [Microbulbifer yueqingensis]